MKQKLEETEANEQLKQAKKKSVVFFQFPRTVVFVEYPSGCLQV